GADQRDVDALVLHFKPERIKVAMKRVFAGRIRGSSRTSKFSNNTGHGHDVPRFPYDHGRENQPGQFDGAEKIDFKQSAGHFRDGFHGVGSLTDASIVDQNINTTSKRNRLP